MRRSTRGSLRLLMNVNQFELPHEYFDGGEAISMWKAG